MDVLAALQGEGLGRTNKGRYQVVKASITSINGVVVTWVVAIDPPGVRFPLNACPCF